MTIVKSPAKFHIITSNVCNLKCIMCPYHSDRYIEYYKSDFFDKPIFMSEKTFSKIAEYVNKNKMSLQFGQLEEPLMHKNIFKFLNMINKESYIHITTNGTLLNDYKIDKLLNSGINSFMVSIDAATSEMYEKIRGGNLDKLERNVKKLIKKASKNGIRSMVSFVMNNESIHEKELFFNKWKDSGVRQITFYIPTNFIPETGKQVRYDMYDKGKRFICDMPWRAAVIYPNGEISLCCNSMIEVGWRGIVSMGNINNSSIDDIWYGKRYETLRKELESGKFKEFDVCRNCEIWSAGKYIKEEYKDYIRQYNETLEVFTFRI